MPNTNIASLYTNIAGTKQDFKQDWTETSNADWKTDWLTGVAPDVIPVNTAAPVIAGTLQVGDTLTVTPGTWTGTPAPVITYQWRNDNGPIFGATALTYVLQAADLNKAVACDETATNAAGIVVKRSNILGPVIA